MNLNSISDGSLWKESVTWEKICEIKQFEEVNLVSRLSQKYIIKKNTPVIRTHEKQIVIDKDKIGKMMFVFNLNGKLIFKYRIESYGVLKFNDINVSNTIKIIRFK